MSFEKTNQELKDELLIAYRLHFSAICERDRLRDRLAVSKRKQKEAEKDADDELKISQELRERNRELYAENFDFALAAYNHALIVDATLNLIGEVIVHEARFDHLYGLIDVSSIEPKVEISEPVSSRVTVPMWFMPEREDGGPARCMSCGEPKTDDNHFFICEECFDLDVENDFDLFGPMMAAWGKGERDFPRPGKNAKELAAGEGSGER